MASHERRNFYRINYPVALEFKTVTYAELSRSPEPSQFDVSPYFSLQLQLNELESQTQQLLSKVAELHPNIAQAQRLLNEKIEIIGKTLSQSELKIDAAQVCEINLSEAGFSFYSETPLNIKSLLAVKMVFPSNAMGVLVYAEVVRCRKEDAGYDLGLQFLRMPERVRSALARIIIQAQVRQRRLDADEAQSDDSAESHHE